MIPVHEQRAYLKREVLLRLTQVCRDSRDRIVIFDLLIDGVLFFSTCAQGAGAS